jgi:protein-L-isoaspartate O-methyltransferase
MDRIYVGAALKKIPSTLGQLVEGGGNLGGNCGMR